MAAPAKASTKRVLIDRTQSKIVGATAGAAFVVVFSLFAAKSLISEAGYQNKIISDKKAAVSQLQDDIQSTNSLVASYKGFVGTGQNVLGGNPQGTGAQDGDNGKIVLDALPSKYDFPALATSLEKLLNSRGMQIQSITGTDDEVAQASNDTSADPKPVPMPFQISASGNYQATQNLVTTFQLSIRPFKIKTLQLSGGQGNMTITLSAETYFQPEKDFNVGSEPVE